MRRLLVRSLTFLAGLYFVLKFLLPEKFGGATLATYNSQVLDGFTTLGAMAIGLGIINLFLVHGSKVAFRKPGAFNSSVLLIGLLSMLTITSLDWILTERQARELSTLAMLREYAKKAPPEQLGAQQEKLRLFSDSLAKEVARQFQILEGLSSEKNPEKNPDLSDALNLEIASAKRDLLQVQALVALTKTSGNLPENLQTTLTAAISSIRVVQDKVYRKSLIRHLYNFLNDGLFVSLGAAMFSLLGFYIAAAAYRAFRVRSLESLLMMLAACIVMLGQIPFGTWISPDFPLLREWLLQVPNAGAARAIEIGASVGGLVMAFRMWLSIESESFSKRGNPHG